MLGSLLEVENLHTYLYTRHGVVKAVDGVSFSLQAGESLGLVGESGCGKSMTTLSILRLVPRPAGRIISGRVLLQGEDLLAKSEREMRRIRGGKIAIILQDPLTSLNPAFSIWDQMEEAIVLHQRVRGKTAWQRAVEALGMVRIPSPASRLESFPHQLSGGMRQRVVGAMALSCHPLVLIADEATTSLDVTIQAQYLDLLKDVQARTGTGMIFVTHDFGIVANVCDRVAVMYAGRIVEIAPTRRLFDAPRHPYTVALMNCLPRLDASYDELTSIGGQPPDLREVTEACRFASRCQSRQQEKCQDGYPPMVEIEEAHFVSCWLVA